MAEGSRCVLCGRPLDRPDDPMSIDCGGDCWGCIAGIEADMGYGPSIGYVAAEIENGSRFADGTAKPPPGDAAEQENGA